MNLGALSLLGLIGHFRLCHLLHLLSYKPFHIHMRISQGYISYITKKLFCVINSILIILEMRFSVKKEKARKAA